MDHFKLLREIWPILRSRLLEPLELIPYIRGLTDNDIESIRAAYYTNKMTAIDRLYDALRRRDRKCFYSFLVALLEHGYEDLANDIMGIGSIHLECLPRPNAALIGTRNTSEHRVEPPPVSRVFVQEVSYSSAQSRPIENRAKPFTPEPLTRETELEHVLDFVFNAWAKELNRDHLWRKLGQKFCLTRKEMKELQAESNPGEAVLDLFVKKNPGFRVQDLLQLIEEDPVFSDLLRIMMRDLGEPVYNNLDTISPQEIRGTDNTDEENETGHLGLPPGNDSTSNLQNNENNMVDSQSQNNSSSPAVSSFSQSKMASSSKSLKFSISYKKVSGESLKSATEGITLTGHNMSYNREMSSQKDDQQPPSVTTSVQSESSGISPIIKRSQQEIKRENESKERAIHSSENESKERVIYSRESESKGRVSHSSVSTGGRTSREIEAFHHTSPKSSFLDDNLNNPEDFFKENLSMKKNVMGQSTEVKTRGLDDGAPNLDVESVLTTSDENTRNTSLGGAFQASNIQERGSIVQDEESDSNQEGSSIIKAAKDLREELDNVSLENLSDTTRPPGNSMNIPVPSNGPVVQNEQTDSYQEGSSNAAKELRKKLQEISPEILDMTRPPGNSINIPVQTAGSTEEGNPIAAPDSTVSSGCDLFQSCPGGEGEGQTGSQIIHSTTVPVPATEESGAKNLEMEARELQNDMVNQPSIPSYRDIQNSLPDQNIGREDQQCVNSLVNQFHYDTEETSQSEAHDQSVPVERQNNIPETLEMSEPMSISGVCSNVAGPNDNLVSTTAANNNCSVTSTEES